MTDRKAGKWGLMDTLPVEDDVFFGHTFDVIVQVFESFPLNLQCCQFSVLDIT
jgi:hypothetical protein